MRGFYLIVYAFLAYLALRAVLRWLLQRVAKRDAPSSGGDEMVRDPQCGVFVLKERAVPRRLRGETVFFCGEGCAAAYELERRG